MQLPNWINEVIRRFVPPPTGKVVIELEFYQGGVTKCEVGGIIRYKPEGKESIVEPLNMR